MSEPEVQLRLPALPENVALVRQAMSGVADALEVDPALLADIKTAVTEACNNVVLHAYPEQASGRMEIDANPANRAVTITVRDYGGGMQPHPDESSLGVPTAGFGLPLIAALSDKFEIHGGSGLGIEVRMVFLLAEGAEMPDSPNSSATRVAPEPPTEDSEQAAGVAITPGRMMAPVLGRMVAMLAARSDFSLDRLSDAVLVTDSLSANLGDYISGRYASISFQDGRRKIDLRLGPLVEGGGERLVRAMELPGLDRSLEELADEVKVEAPRAGAEDSNGEYLLIRLSSDDG
jgi:anti-sigma regulatory factor (Ser/Thr protein kinase)